jgi:hypothetical protein
MQINYKVNKRRKHPKSSSQNNGGIFEDSQNNDYDSNSDLNRRN